MHCTRTRVYLQDPHNPRYTYITSYIPGVYGTHYIVKLHVGKAVVHTHRLVDILTELLSVFCVDISLKVFKGKLKVGRKSRREEGMGEEGRRKERRGRKERERNEGDEGREGRGGGREEGGFPLFPLSPVLSLPFTPLPSLLPFPPALSWV